MEQTEDRNEQDEVDYTVSEDRVTGVKMLTRIMGCTGLWWPVLDSSLLLFSSQESGRGSSTLEVGD